MPSSTTALPCSFGNIQRSKLPNPAPVARDGAKMPPGMPDMLVARVLANLAGAN